MFSKEKLIPPSDARPIVQSNLQGDDFATSIAQDNLQK
jgi:hypothetical protein